MVDELTIITILVAVVILGIVTYLELKLIRSKRHAKDEAMASLDDIYNGLVTTKAVSSSLKERGFNTKEADLMLVEAEASYSRGNYTVAKETVEKAKRKLQESKEDEKIRPFQKIIDSKNEEMPRAGQCEVPFAETKKLPKNYMESKFMICAVRDYIAEAEKAGKDTSIAKDHLKSASDSFDKEDYTEALKMSLRARKVMEGQHPSETASPAKQVSRESIGLQRIEASKPARASEHDNASKCPNCGSRADEDDTFCRKCGTKIVQKLKCPSCGTESKEGDVFCRKCGAQLKQTFHCPKCETAVGENDSICPSCGTRLE